MAARARAQLARSKAPDLIGIMGSQEKVAKFY
jgi:NADPH-dependent curcumin reductase CurA